MAKYDYVSVQTVREVCKELGLSDWTQLASGKVSETEAEIIRGVVGGEATDIPLEVFRLGLEVELEHGKRFPDANVTNNHPILTGRIVLAHLKEGLDYYQRLAFMELEMELDAAVKAGDEIRVSETKLKLAKARAALGGAKQC